MLFYMCFSSATFIHNLGVEQSVWYVYTWLFSTYLFIGINLALIRMWCNYGILQSKTSFSMTTVETDLPAHFHCGNAPVPLPFPVKVYRPFLDQSARGCGNVNCINYYVVYILLC